MAYVAFEHHPFWRQRWREETGVSDPLLLDPKKTLYAAFGMYRYRLKSWSPRTILYYLRVHLFTHPPASTRADTHQLGGDFIIDANRVVRFAGISHSPLDRPSMKDIQEAARSLALPS